MQALSSLLSDLKAQLNSATYQYLVVRDPALYKAHSVTHTKNNNNTKEPLKLTPAIVIKEKQIPKPEEKKQIFDTTTPKQDKFTSLIKTLNPNFAFSDSLQTQDKETAKTIVCLAENEAQKKLLQIYQQKVAAIYRDISVLMLEDICIEKIQKLGQVKLIIALQGFERNQRIQKHLKIFPAKVLKKIGTIPFLTIKEQESLDNITLCIKRLKL